MLDRQHRRYRESPRLKGFDYMGPLAAHLIFVTRERKPLIETEEVAHICIEALERAAAKHTAKLHAFCLMPDHAQILIEIPESESLEEFAKDFKQFSAFQIKQVSGKAAWQVSYYDHILRRDENLLDVAQYIWDNPVKAGLAKNWSSYPFSGPRETLGAAGQA